MKKRTLLESLLHDFGLGHIRSSRGSSLSGERRRVENARALALEQNLFLDEPFAGVDPLAVSDIQILSVPLSPTNIGVLITDHNVRRR